MDDINGALARFSNARRESEADEQDAADYLDARRQYTLDRVLCHTNALALVSALTEAAELLDACKGMRDCPSALRVRSSSLALKEWSGWISYWAKSA